MLIVADDLNKNESLNSLNVIVEMRKEELKKGEKRLGLSATRIPLHSVFSINDGRWSPYPVKSQSSNNLGALLHQCFQLFPHY